MFGDPATNPKGWEYKLFGEIMFIDAPMVDPRLDEYLDMPHIGPDRIEKGTGRILPALTAREDRLISGKFLFDRRHVLYSKIRPLLRKAALPHFKGLCSADMYPIRPNENYTNREFLWSILLSDAFTKFTQTIASRANIPKINRDELGSFKCILPHLELQRQYATIINSYQVLYDKLSNNIKACDNLLGSLSKRAFRGEL
jgi:type I restriction enzyme S subunit